MKFRSLLIFTFLITAVLVVRSSDNYLLPQNFFLHKGDNLTLRLLSSGLLDKETSVKYQQAQTVRFVLHEGSKVTDLKSTAKEADSILLNYKVQNNGLDLVEMTQNYPGVDLDRSAFIKELDEQGLTKLSEKANAGYQQDIKEKYTSYLKTLFMVDKPAGDIFKKEFGHELEITLLQNPYKAVYGDDMTALVKFKGKPLANAHVDLVVKTSGGKISTERLNSDATGNVFFKLSLEGNYMLRLVNIEAVKAKDVDYEKWAAAFTFAFKNSLGIPNNY